MVPHEITTLSLGKGSQEMEMEAIKTPSERTKWLTQHLRTFQDLLMTQGKK